MKRVFSAESLPPVAHIRNLLESEGIECQIRNENGSSLMGEVPFTSVWPEVWILNDADLHRAEAVLARARAPLRVDGPPWICRHCETDNEYQFGACWNCGRAAGE